MAGRSDQYVTAEQVNEVQSEISAAAQPAGVTTALTAVRSSEGNMIVDAEQIDASYRVAVTISVDGRADAGQITKYNAFVTPESGMRHSSFSGWDDPILSPGEALGTEGVWRGVDRCDAEHGDLSVGAVAPGDVPATVMPKGKQWNRPAGYRISAAGLLIDYRR